MRRIIDTIERKMLPLRQCFRWVTFAMMAVLILLPTVQIVMRQIVGVPIIGAEELARVLLIGTVYVSLPQLVYAGASIRLEELISLLPRSWLRWLHGAISLFSAAIFAVIAASVWEAVMVNLETTTPTLEVPYWTFLAPALAGSAFAAVEFLILVAKFIVGMPPYVVLPGEEDELGALTL